MAVRVFLLFSHTLTAEQKEELSVRWDIEHFRPLPEDLQQIWSNVPPDVPGVESHVQPVLDWLNTEAKSGDVVLVQGDFGATYLTVTFCFRNQLVAIYAATRRVHQETVDNDGSIATHKVFQHALFREYGK